MFVAIRLQKKSYLAILMQKYKMTLSNLMILNGIHLPKKRSMAGLPNTIRCNWFLEMAFQKTSHWYFTRGSKHVIFLEPIK